jgi:RNA polymerase sigma-70 factor (ECF subfamily)
MNNPQQEFERIIRPIEDRMMSTIWRILRNASDAEDALQSVLEKLWRDWRRVVKHPNPPALVLKICVDAAYDAWRRRQRQRSRQSRRNVTLAETAINDGKDLKAAEAIDVVADDEFRASVMTAIAQLSRNQAIATLMRLVQDAPYDQIAAALGCSEVTARKHVERGRAKLRSSLAAFDPKSSERSMP